jgi:hypothetical protein
MPISDSFVHEASISQHSICGSHGQHVVEGLANVAVWRASRMPDATVSKASPEQCICSSYPSILAECCSLMPDCFTEQVYNSETRQMQSKYGHIPQSRLGYTNTSLTVQAQPVLQAVIEQ